MKELLRQQALVGLQWFLGILLICGVLNLAGYQGSRVEAGPQRERWEYTQGAPKWDEDLGTWMNERGRAGWELVQGPSYQYHRLYIFKRRLP